MTEPHPDAIGPDQANPQDATQEEVRAQAEAAGDDPVTRREALETELMAEGDSDTGEQIGEPTS